MGSLSGRCEIYKLQVKLENLSKRLLDTFSRWRVNNDKWKKRHKVWGCELNSCGSGQSLAICLYGFIKLDKGGGAHFTGCFTRRISRMDLFHVVNFFLSAVSTECRHHVVSIYNLCSADPGFKSWQKARFFPHPFQFLYSINLPFDAARFWQNEIIAKQLSVSRKSYEFLQCHYHF
jgi:hypothetical protein